MDDGGMIISKLSIRRSKEKNKPTATKHEMG